MPPASKTLAAAVCLVWMLSAGAVTAQQPAAPAAPVESDEQVAPLDPAADPETERRIADMPIREPLDKRITVDAMVGQVNGKPIYASEIFRQIGEQQLDRLGTTLPRIEFRREVVSLVVKTLRSEVQNALILAEAERDLTEQQQLGLLGALEVEREKMLARYGNGVPAVADETMRRELGFDLDTALRFKRQEILVSKYRREKILPQIHVTRREVERYYRDNFQQFNSAPTVTVRVIIVPTEAEAKKVEADLAAGVSFADAAKKHSTYRRTQGGLMDPFVLRTPVNQFNELVWPQLNEQVRTLAVGQHSPPLKIDRGYGFVFIENVAGGKSQPLSEVFLDIERGLRRQKANQTQLKNLQKLMEEGNYTPIDVMGPALVEVAMSRYARNP